MSLKPHGGASLTRSGWDSHMEMAGWEIAVGQQGWVEWCQIQGRNCEISQGDHMAGLRFEPEV